MEDRITEDRWNVMPKLCEKLLHARRIEEQARDERIVIESEIADFVPTDSWLYYGTDCEEADYEQEKNSRNFRVVLQLSEIHRRFLPEWQWSRRQRQDQAQALGRLHLQQSLSSGR